jgi:hypothetical protein
MKDRGVGSRSAAGLVGLPVCLHDTHLGRAVDLLLDAGRTRVLGFVVESSGATQRFLPFGASQPGHEEIAVQSALMLLDDVGFYRKRGTSLRSLIGTQIDGGRLTDMRIGQGGEVVELELDRAATAA